MCPGTKFGLVMFPFFHIYLQAILYLQYHLRLYLGLPDFHLQHSTILKNKTSFDIYNKDSHYNKIRIVTDQASRL